MNDYTILEKSNETSANSAPSNAKKPKKDFFAYTPQWTMSEIVLRDTVRDSIEDVIAFCKNREMIKTQWQFNKFLKGSGTICVNIYGEPGTGKTTAANAIVNAIGCKAVEVRLAEILGNLQGQTEQNMTALFEIAQQNNHIIIFNDADSLLTQRSVGTANSESSNVSKDHLLNLLDSTNGIIIFTTNFMKSYDEAFKSRMLFNIHIPLPNKSERESIWKFHLNENVPKNISYDELAAITDGLSGRNIRQLTMIMGIRLTVGKITYIDSSIVKEEVMKIKEIHSTSGDVTKVAEAKLPECVKQNL